MNTSNGSDPRGRRPGQSIANLWAEMVQAAVEGEVVAVTDKHGNDVAVMIGLEMWDAMQATIREHEGG